MEKTCNFSGYCAYKSLSTTNFGCKWYLFCDYQAPRDSRTLEVGYDPSRFKREYLNEPTPDLNGTGRPPVTPRPSAGDKVPFGG